MGPPCKREWIDCRRFDGTPLPVDKCNQYREVFGLPPLTTHTAPERITQEPWTVDKPARGLGDVIAKVTHYTGIEAAVNFVTRGKCGCKQRQARLNDLVPFKTE